MPSSARQPSQPGPSPLGAPRPGLRRPAGSPQSGPAAHCPPLSSSCSPPPPPPPPPRSPPLWAPAACRVVGCRTGLGWGAEQGCERSDKLHTPVNLGACIQVTLQGSATAAASLAGVYAPAARPCQTTPHSATPSQLRPLAASRQAGRARKPHTPSPRRGYALPPALPHITPPLTAAAAAAPRRRPRAAAWRRAGVPGRPCRARSGAAGGGSASS